MRRAARTVRVLRERIDPRLTASLFANYRSATDALLELIDNAVDSRLPGTPLRVEVVSRPGTISLTAVGGMGMGPSELERDYLRWGASPKRSGERIGRFGQGGKAAIGHLGNRFTILAGPAGDHRAYRFEDKDYRDRSRLRTCELTAGQRALDPRLRSAMVIEDGIRRVVINSRYPLYEVRKGDLWYQLETALQEVCVTIPEATVPEFERKVNDLMLVSLNLAGRRHRRRKAGCAQPLAPWARSN